MSGTPPSRNPRTLPYCVLAMAERGVEQLPGSWWAAVLTLSDARAVLLAAILIPAVAERKSASRRVRSVRLVGLDMNSFPFLQEGMSDFNEGVVQHLCVS